MALIVKSRILLDVFMNEKDREKRDFFVCDKSHYFVFHTYLNIIRQIHIHTLLLTQKKNLKKSKRIQTANVYSSL